MRHFLLMNFAVPQAFSSRMESLITNIQTLRNQALDCDLISGLATDLNKREFFTKLAVDLRAVANDLEIFIPERRPTIP
jgi:hypothetical protein